MDPYKLLHACEPIAKAKLERIRNILLEKWEKDKDVSKKTKMVSIYHPWFIYELHYMNWDWEIVSENITSISILRDLYLKYNKNINWKKVKWEKIDWITIDTFYYNLPIDKEDIYISFTQIYGYDSRIAFDEWYEEIESRM